MLLARNRVAFVATHRDDYMTTRETFDAYRQDPDRLKRKQEEKEQRREGREVVKRQRREQDVPAGSGHGEGSVGHRQGQAVQLQSVKTPFPKPPPSDDWLGHNGNVHYTHSREAFENYRPIGGKAVLHILPGLHDPLRVFGMGDVRLKAKKQLGTEQRNDLLLTEVLHIPDALCNGLSWPRMNKAGYYRLTKPKPNHKFSVGSRREQSKATLCCGKSSSGRDKFCLYYESEDTEMPEHSTLGWSIDISADVKEILSALDARPTTRI